MEMIIVYKESIKINGDQKKSRHLKLYVVMTVMLKQHFFKSTISIVYTLFEGGSQAEVVPVEMF
jgi:hypothetical protein